MTDAQTELIRNLEKIEQLARQRVHERPDGPSHEYYKRIASIASDHTKWLVDQNFPHMGTGAGLGLSKGLSEWGFPENGDREMMDLAYKADRLHQTGELI